MSRGFYNYDTRPAPAYAQIATLERLLEEANSRIEDLEWENKGIEEWRDVAVQAITKLKEKNEECLALRGMLAEWVDPSVDGISREELINQTCAILGKES